MTTYFANPGDNLVAKTSVLLPGDTLNLNGGTYNVTDTNHSLFLRNISGLAAAPIIIQATNDGQVIIDGGGAAGVNEPTFITNCSYITIRGIRFQNSFGSVIKLFGDTSTGNGPVNYITFQRCSAHGAADGNHHVFDVSFYCRNVLVEDCAAWGPGRYMFLAYRCYNTIFRRCFAYWNTINDPVLQPRSNYGNYGSANTLFENCIGRHAYPTSTDTGNYYVNYWQDADDPVNYPSDNPQVLGCIFYDAYDGLHLNEVTGINAYIKDCYFEAPLSNETFTGKESGNGLWSDDKNSFTITNCTFRNNGRNAFVRNSGSASASITSCLFTSNTIAWLINTSSAAVDPGHDHCGFHNNGTLGTTLVGTDRTLDPGYDTTTYGRGGALFVKQSSPYKGGGVSGSDIGANILYTYQSGMLTNTPLWPWPMEDRVFSELGQSPTYTANGGLWNTLVGLYPGIGMTAPKSVSALVAHTYSGRSPVPVVFPEALPSSHWYAVGGVLLDQPTICTAPLPQGNMIHMGNTFVLLFQSPSSFTQMSLSNGTTVSMTFLLHGGTAVTGPVTCASILVGNVFHVVCTVAADIPLSS